jgi:hypothetical protein
MIVKRILSFMMLGALMLNATGMEQPKSEQPAGTILCKTFNDGKETFLRSNKESSSKKDWVKPETFVQQHAALWQNFKTALNNEEIWLEIKQKMADAQEIADRAIEPEDPKNDFTITFEVHTWNKQPWLAFFETIYVPAKTQYTLKINYLNDSSRESEVYRCTNITEAKIFLVPEWKKHALYAGGIFTFLCYAGYVWARKNLWRS